MSHWQFRRRWLDRKLRQLDAQPKTKPNDWHPVIREFRNLIEGDPVLCMNFTQMFEPNSGSITLTDDKDSNRSQVRDYMHMLELFNYLLGWAPEWECNDLGQMGILPFLAILEWSMNTSAGREVFSDLRVNAQFKQMFDVWAEYLSSYDSTYVLNADDGWLRPSAIKDDFAQTFVCDTTQPHFGFKSWDDFFTRRLRPGVRPVVEPDNDSIITSACESHVLTFAHGVQAKDKFWLKGCPYTLETMFNYDPLTQFFIGGTVYQGFLASTNYHRWHSPIDGVVVKIVHVLGTYYLQSPWLGFETAKGPDYYTPDDSQVYLSHSQTRSLLFVEANNPDIGLMCIMMIGMVEISTCEVTVREGARIKKGDELGTFHFGGSTHCLVFRPQTKLVFGVMPEEGVKVNQEIARLL
ncbi:phosphatidylserine decarboxylase-like protein [Marasmius fiardii PR-910]|nr:phosphatidylserine decarboxylase-like protein [Marasmius fiardii PR-910]